MMIHNKHFECKIPLVMFSIATLFATTATVGQERASPMMSRFTANCMPQSGRRFDHALSPSGTTVASEWTDNESFLDSSSWPLKFDGVKTLTVDNTTYLAFPRSEAILTAITYDPAPGAANGRMWIINLQMGRAIYTQVQAGDLFGTNLMARTVEFKCAIAKS